MEKKIAVIGGGNMGGALIKGFIESGEFKAGEITVSDKSADVRGKFSAMGVNTSDNNAEAVKNAEIVLIGVKPYLVEVIADEIKHSLTKDQIVVSMAAEVTLEALHDVFGSKNVLCRVIPNIAAEYRMSMTFLSFDSAVSNGVSDKIIALFKTVGEVVVIDEKLIDAAMSSASCGTAFAIRYIRAAMEASIQMGLTAADSKLVVSQTVKGATELLLNNKNSHPEEIIDKVTTPGGITIVGLNEMEHNGFSSAVIKGHLAAYKKAKGE